MNYQPRSVAGKCVRHYRSVPPVLVLGSGVCVVWLAAAAGVRRWGDGQGRDRARGGLTPASQGTTGPHRHLQGGQGRQWA